MGTFSALLGITLYVFTCTALAQSPTDNEAVPGEFLLKYSSKRVSQSAQLTIQRSLGVKVVESHPITGSVLVQSLPGQPVDDAYAKRLLADGTLEYFEPNYIIHTVATPNDPQLSQLWGLHNAGQTGGVVDVDIDAPEAWDISTGSGDVVVGVVDTGIDFAHPDLTANMWRNPGEVANGIDDDHNGVVDDIYGYNAIHPELPPSDDNGHGTHCAGTIGASGNNGTGVVGVNWQVKLMALKFLSASGSGTTSDAVRAIEYAVHAKQSGVNIRVLSNSWGGGDYSQALADAIRAASQVGILFVAAAGNSAANNDDAPSYPASYDIANVLSVAAIDDNGNLASFSNYGAGSVHLAAPGVGIYSTMPGARYQTLSGTSMATPHVSGVAALVAANVPTLTVAELRARLLTTVKPLSTLSGTIQYPGIVDAYRALTNTQTPLPPSAPSQRYRRSPASFAYDSELGERILQVDDGYSDQSLPFEFPYYGASFARIAVSANGRIVPLAADQSLPTSSDYSNKLSSGIYVLNDDLYPSPNAISGGSGGVWIKRSAQSVTVTWVSVPYAYRASTDPRRELRFQARIFPSGRIEYHYLDTTAGDVAFDSGASATVGLAPPGAGERLVVSHNTADAGTLGDGHALSLRLASQQTRNDLDGDGISDIIVWRPNTGMWYVLRSVDGFDFEKHWSVQLGLPGDIPLTGDYDGDLQTDLAVWRPTTGTWYFRTSGSGYGVISSVQWGLGTDRPLSGDVDGDGRTDLIVYRPNDGFYTLRSSSGFSRDAALLGDHSAMSHTEARGYGNDPLLGDFNGDGTDELITVWQLIRFWTASTRDGTRMFSLPWGEPGDSPLICDWDASGVNDRVQVRVAPNYELQWFAVTETGLTFTERFGSILDKPSCDKDYDGDGKGDLAVFRPYTGTWFIKGSAAAGVAEHQFGLPGDVPL